MRYDSLETLHLPRKSSCAAAAPVGARIAGQRAEKSDRTDDVLRPVTVDAAFSDALGDDLYFGGDRRQLHAGDGRSDRRSLDPAHSNSADGENWVAQQRLLGDLTGRLRDLQIQQEQIRELLASVQRSSGNSEASSTAG